MFFKRIRSVETDHVSGGGEEHLHNIVYVYVCGRSGEYTTRRK